MRNATPQQVLESIVTGINTGDLEMTGRTLFFKLSYAWTP